MNNKIKIISIAIVSLFFSKLVSAEVAPGFNSWDDVKAAAQSMKSTFVSNSDRLDGYLAQL